MTTPIVPPPPDAPTPRRSGAYGGSGEIELVRAALTADYEVLEEIGRGGMAMVYRAREKALDREVAIKVLPGRLAMDADFIERFQHEARTAGRLEHPNIVPIYRVGRAGPAGDIIYFVMKLLRGQSLSAVLRERRKLDAAEVRRILIETAGALGYAARRSVVHRDIKPDNILLDSEGRCVITDFGIAKTPGGQQTAAGTSLGTPRYMSPEHAQGSPLDGRSDVYSLGVVAYQCLTGKTPFDADDPFAVLYKHINEPVPDPTLETDEQRQLYAVIARMLAKKPDDRFQTGDEVIAALGGHVSGPTTLVATVPAGPGMMLPTEIIATPMPWTRLLATRQRRTWAMGVGGAVLAAGAWFALHDSSAAQTPAAAEPRQAAAAIPDSSSAKLAAGDSGATTAAAGVVAPPVVVAPPPKPAGPSKRAAAIIAANALRSNCPTRDTMPASKAIAYALRADSIAPQKRDAKMAVNYDVCGLAAGSPFRTEMTLTKVNQRGFLGLGKQGPKTETFLESAAGPRSRKRQTVDLATLSPGNYRLDIVVTDARKRPLTTGRAFQILDK